MMLKLSRIIFVLSLLLASCGPKSTIHIGDNLELELASNYSDYVTNLNRSVNGDAEALKKVLLFHECSDGACFDHGWVLVELLEKVGDHNFTRGLRSLNDSELKNAVNLFWGGMDVHALSDSIGIKYPTTAKIIGVE